MENRIYCYLRKETNEWEKEGMFVMEEREKNERKSGRCVCSGVMGYTVVCINLKWDEKGVGEKGEGVKRRTERLKEKNEVICKEEGEGKKGKEGKGRKRKTKRKKKRSRGTEERGEEKYV